MGHVVSKQPWGTLDINTDTGVILVREDWKYIWDTPAGVKNFTIAQKRAFHRRLDREIWGKWSWKFHPKPVGAAPFAQRFASRPLVINFDIRWVLHNSQWEVEVVRLAAGTTMNKDTRSWVKFSERRILLYSLIFVPYQAGNQSGASRKGFLAGPHQFGHTLNYPDDYDPVNGFLGDTDSIMNVGRELRNRHIALIINTLNTMIPGVSFQL